MAGKNFICRAGSSGTPLLQGRGGGGAVSLVAAIEQHRSLPTEAPLAVDV